MLSLHLPADSNNNNNKAVSHALDARATKEEDANEKSQVAWVWHHAMAKA